MVNDKQRRAAAMSPMTIPIAGARHNDDPLTTVDIGFHLVPALTFAIFDEDFEPCSEMRGASLVQQFFCFPLSKRRADKVNISTLRVPKKRLSLTI